MMAGGAALWLACLAYMWGWVFDTSGTTTLLATAGAMLSLATAAAAVPAFRRRRADAGDGVGDGATSAGWLTAPRRAGLAGLAVLAGGLVTTAALLPASRAADQAAAALLWTEFSWGAFQLICIWAATLPLSVGIACLWRATRRLAGEPSALGLGLLGTAAGMAGMGGVVIIGISLPAGALAAAAMVLLGAIWALLGADGSVATANAAGVQHSKSPTVASPAWSVLPAGLMAMIILLAQWRLMQDALGVGLPGRLAWTGGTLAVTAVFLLRLGRRRAGGDGAARAAGVHSPAAAVGVVAGVLMQVGLLASAHASGKTALAGMTWFPLMLAALCQLPIAALGARLLAAGDKADSAPAGQGRRDHRGRNFAALATGACLGVLAYILAIAGGYAWQAAAGLAGAILLAAAGAGLLRAHPGYRGVWAWSLVFMIGSLAAVGYASHELVRDDLDAVRPGVWMSIRSPGAQGAYLGDCGPGATAWPAAMPPGQIDAAICEMMAPWPGASAWVLDPSGRHEGLGSPVAPCGEFLGRLHYGRQAFDRILLAGPPVEHESWWRFANNRTLGLLGGRLQPDGVVLLRLTADAAATGDSLSRLLAAARTFQAVAGGRWAMVELAGGRVDILLSSGELPPRFLAATRPSGDAAAVVVPIEDLWADWAWLPIIRCTHPYRMLPSISLDAFTAHLAGRAGTISGSGGR